MKMYVIEVYPKGSLKATDLEPKVSKLGLKREPGQRYQVPSVMENVKNSGNQELIDAVTAFTDDIAQKVFDHGFAVIEWALPTDTKMIIQDKNTGEFVEISRKWADWDMDKLDAVLTTYLTPVGAGAAAGNAGNNTTTGRTGNNRPGVNLNR